MPNWCEGSLKVRGKTEDILRFVKEGIEAYKKIGGAAVETKEWLEIQEDSTVIDICFNHTATLYFYVANTTKAFLNFRHLIVEWYSLEKDSTDEICIFCIAQAWGFRKDEWAEIAKKYNLDIKLYGIEQGMGLEEDIWIFDHGTRVEDHSKLYKDYKNFLWECPLPCLGG